jgi:hypothetical protein
VSALPNIAAPLSPRASDIIPALHLSSLAGKTAATLCIIGDSTSTYWHNGADFRDRSQTLWGALTNAFARQNPGIAWNFQNPVAPEDDPGRGNYGIGATSWNHPPLAGEAIGVTLPGWFTDKSRSWLSYVEAARPDVLVLNFGVNTPNLGTVTAPGSSNFSHYIDKLLLAIDGWAKVPNVIFATNKVPNGNVTNPPPGTSLLPAAHYLAAASLVRSFARSAGNGFAGRYVSPNLKHFGLIDINRRYCALVLGRDVDTQYLRAQEAARVNGVALGETPVAIGTTTDGDFSLALNFPGQGADVLSTRLADTGGGTGQIKFGFSAYVGNLLALRFTGSSFNFAYTTVYNSAPQTVTLPGGPITLPPGDLTLKLTFKNELLLLSVNNTAYPPLAVPRAICGGRVTIQTAGTPLVSPVMNVLDFYEGIAVATPIALSEDTHWGAYGNNAVVYNGPFGGNGYNHSGAIGTAVIDDAVVQALPLAAPAAAAVGTPFIDWH